MLCHHIAYQVEQVVSEPGRILMYYYNQRICLPLHNDRDNIDYSDFEKIWFVE